MIVTNALLILSILTLLTQAASLPNGVIPQQQIDELKTNAELLSQEANKGKTKYGKICKSCAKYPMIVYMTRIISETSVKKAVEESQSSLLPFVTLLFDMAHEEKDLTLKKLLVTIGIKLNETYDTTVMMIGKLGRSQSKTLTSLNKETAKFLKAKGIQENPEIYRNYNVMRELDIQGFNIAYAIGKLSNGVNVLKTRQKN